MAGAISSAVLIQPISAITPSYSVGKYYKKSKYYERLLAVEETGDERYDVLSVAVSQLGYHEGNSDADMGGGNRKGSRNFTEYNRIIGAPVDNGEGNGVSYGFEWCAAFVSWCLRQADVPASSAVTEISCIRMLDWLRTRGLYKSRSSGYSPKPADLVFFRASSSSSRASHVGLYLGSDATYIYTVEGNNSDRVNYQRYRKNDALILGYGTPDYDTLPGTKYDFELRQSYIEPGIYITTDDLNIRTGTSTSYPSLGKIPKGTSIMITEGVGDWARVSYNGKTGWSSLDYLEFAEGMKYSVEYDGNGGSSVPGTQTKEYGKALALSGIIPEKSAHIFLGWSTDKNAVKPEYTAGASYTAEKDVKLYAVWEYVGYTVSFYGDNGELIDSRRYDLGDKLVFPDAPEKKGDILYRYEFSGWTPEPPETVSADASFTATYKKISVFATSQEQTDPIGSADTPEEGTNADTEAPEHTSAAAFDIASALAGITAFLCAAAVFFVKKKS